MVEIYKPRIECIDSPEDPAHGIFIVEPLERGYGTTLGNSLTADEIEFIETHVKEMA